jgi:RimJ/RimL family protein N-acetyltransferase
MEPLLIDVPERLDTERFILRSPRMGDGALINAAVCDTLYELRPWMAWAQVAPSPDESEAYCRRNEARFRLREDLPFFIFEREPDGGEGVLVGASGLHSIDWALRRFEIGYWRRFGLQGQGIATEAVRALNRLAFDRLDARRVEIRMDDDNVASSKVAERAGFTFEGLLRCDSLAVDGAPRNTRVYARVRGIEEPEVSVEH